MTRGAGGSPVIDEAVVRLVADVRTFLTQVDNATNKAVTGLKKVDQEAGKAEAGVEKMGGAFAKVGAAVAMLGGAFAALNLAKGAAQYETTLARIGALTALTAEQVKKVEGAILDMSVDIGKGPNELAEGFYFAASTIDDVDKAMAVLTASAKAASVGLGDTKTVVDALTSAMNAYNLGAEDAARVTDILLNTVKYGKMEPADLAGSIGRVLPVAATLGVELEDLGASLAVLSNVGLSTEEAVTAVRQVLVTLINPSVQADDLLKSLGISAKDLRDNLGERGLLPTLNMIIDATQGNVDALSEIFPNIRALIGVLGTAGVQGQRYGEILEGIREGTGATDKAFGDYTKTVDYAASRMKATFEAAVYRLALTVLPTLSASINDVTKALRVAGPAFDAAGIILKGIAALVDVFRPALIALTAAWVAHRLVILANALAMKSLAVQSAIGMGTMSASRAVMVGIVASLKSWQGAVAGAVIGLTLMDAIIRRTTGSGLLDWLSGAAQKQRDYNDALEKYANAQERINALQEVGMNEAKARALVIAEKAAAMKEQADIIAANEQILAEIGAKAAASGSRIDVAIRRANQNLRVLMEDLEKLQGGRPTPIEILTLTGGDPVLLKLYAERLKEIAEAKEALQVEREAEQINALAKSMREAAEGTEDMGESAAEAKAAYSALGAAISLALDQFKAPDPVVAMLKLEQEELERTKAYLGDAFGPEQEARLRAITAAIDQQESKLKITEGAIAVYGYALAKAIGPGGAETHVKALANYLADLPSEVRTEIQMLLPTMQMGQLVAFLANLERTHNVKIALQFSTQVAAELAGKVKPVTEMFAGKPISIMPESVEAELKRYGLSLDQIRRWQEGASAAEKEGAASAAALGDASGGAAEQISAEAQALLDLVKAANLSGLSWEEYSFILDVIAKGMKVFNLTSEQMVAMLKKSGLVVTEFARRLWALEVLEAVKARAKDAADAVNDLYDAFNRLFAQPTREEAALNLRLAKLKEQREQALQGGKGNVKGYVAELDKSIATIEDELELRRLHNDVLKAELDLADRARITDQNQQQMARNLIDAMGETSQKAADMAWNLWISTAALQAWTTDLGRWMAAVGAAPAYQGGGIVPGSAGQATLAWLHGGEVVLNAAQAGALSRGDINVPITINADSASFEDVKAAAHAAVEEALTYARARWYRSGASLSASIG